MTPLLTLELTAVLHKAIGVMYWMLVASSPTAMYIYVIIYICTCTRCNVFSGFQTNLTTDVFIPFDTSNHNILHYSEVTWASWHVKSPATPLFVQSFVRLYFREDTKAQHFLPFVSGIQWLVDSPHKGPVTWETFPCHDIITSMG